MASAPPYEDSNAVLYPTLQDKSDLQADNYRLNLITKLQLKLEQE